MIKRPFFTTGQAAAELGVNRATILSWIARGLVLSGTTPTGQHTISRTELERLKSQMSGAGKNGE